MELKMKTDQKLKILSDPKTVHNTIVELWEAFPDYDKNRENMFILYLDLKNRLLCVELHSQGTINQCIIYPREVIRKSLFCNAGSIILIHNHPSGSNDPSHTDVMVTNKIKEACKIMDINVLDHLIISDNKEYYSFQETGQL